MDKKIGAALLDRLKQACASVGPRMSQRRLQQLRHGPLMLDLNSLRLTRDGAQLPLAGLPLRLLRYLLDSQGRVVTRAELKRAFWPNTVRIDTERRLNTAMRALRGALGETAEGPLYVQTLRGHGYRWIGPKRQAPENSRRRHLLAPVLALVLLLAGSGVPLPPAGPAPDQEARFVRLAAAAQADPAGAASGLDALVREQPSYIAPHILRAQLAMSEWRDKPTATDLAEARKVLARAQQAVGDTAEMDALSAELALGADWDWGQAERLYRRALASDPANVRARQGLAWLYVNSGRPERAWPEMARLLAVVPLTPDLRANLGWLMLRSGRADLALDFCPATPGETVNMLSCRHTALAQTGAMAEARAAAVDLLGALAADRSVIAEVRDGAAEQGYRTFLRWRVDHFLPPGDHWFQRAQLEAEAGQYAAALVDLERAAALRDPSLVKIRSTGAFDRLAGSPRYRALVANIFASRETTGRAS